MITELKKLIQAAKQHTDLSIRISIFSHGREEDARLIDMATELKELLPKTGFDADGAKEVRWLRFSNQKNVDVVLFFSRYEPEKEEKEMPDPYSWLQDLRPEDCVIDVSDIWG